MNKIIKNTDNGKYFTDRYQNGFWSKDIEEAYLFSDQEDIYYYINKLRESSDNPFEDIKMILIETVCKFNK